MNSGRYIRQMTFQGVGKEGQKRLEESRVCIIGAGALGSRIANDLGRSGVGFIRVIDRDTTEITNLQRQVLFTEEDVREELPKAEAVARHIRAVNSQIMIEPVIADVNAGNIESLIHGADVVMDGTDNFEIRYLMNEACHKLQIPWVYASVIAGNGSVMAFTQKEDAPCFRCLMPDVPAPGTYETCTTVGVINPITGIIAGYSCMLAMKILLKKEVPSGFYVISAWDDLFQKIPIKKNTECPLCKKKQYDILEHKTGDFSSSLCGHNAWQIVPMRKESDGNKVDLKALGHRLERSGTVSVTKFLLKFESDPVFFKVFPDGRAIIENVEDELVARKIYAEYIG